MSKKFLLSPEDWLIKEEGFHFNKQGQYESLFSLGNGYLGVRGSLEENPHGSYRGMYLAGLFDKSEAYVTEIIKMPVWIDFSVWINDFKFNTDTCKVLSHRRILDLRKGILHRTTCFKDPQGRILKLEIRRVVFAHQVRGAVLDVSITPENFSGEIKIISGLNGDVTNQGYFLNERTKHLNLVSMDREKDQIYLEMETRERKVRVALAASTLQKLPHAHSIRVSRIYGEKLAQEISLHVEKGKSYHFTKWVSILTSREGYEKQLKAAATDLLNDMIHDGLDYHLQKHIEAREKDWERIDILIKGDRRAQKGIRFNLYHLLIAKPHHDPTVSIGARFLTGEGYKGHAFWDTEIFVLPFYLFNFPEDVRNLLMYRYYTLKGAMENARALGYRGAKYAWESADTGIETAPSYGLRPDGTADKIFTGEEEHHIVSDVVYGICKYVEATGDFESLYKYEAEIVFQTARFWLSRVEKRRDRYEIRKVIGPDEFHEHVDNNAFTNYLVMWHLDYAVNIYKKMQKESPEQFNALVKKIKLKESEIEKMKTISKTIFFPYDQKTELIEQFEGYFSLEDHRVSKLDRHGLPLYPRGLDRSNLHRTQLIKQADIVLLLHLFSDRFSAQLKKVNYNYYEARTLHKSSLSPCIYAIMGLETGEHKHAYNYFVKTSHIDLLDAAKNTKDGIHAAATGGAWMTVIHGFAGMRVRRGNLYFNPWLPKRWQEFSFHCMWQGNLLKVEVTHRYLIFKVISAKDKMITVNVQGRAVRLKPKGLIRLRLRRKYT